MTWRTIMVQLLDDEGLEQRLAVARALAQRFSAHLVGAHVVAPPVLTMGFGETAAYGSAELVRLQQENAMAVAARVRARFDAFMQESGLSFASRIEHSDPATHYAGLARVADLAVVARSVGSGIDALMPEICEQLAMASGVPTLIVPSVARKPEHDDPCPGRIVFGWSGSRESARALRDALPLLRQAGTVRIVSVGDRRAMRIEDLLSLLERHQIRADLHLVEDEAADPAEVIEADIRNTGADLLVIGAYGHTRLRELIFGGVTRHVLERTNIPVLFSA